ncbi:MAG TPA: thioredoxin-like domain-containing protein [Chthoniobacteraceae bacterium]|jgi:nucleoredoxin|nr:thioredoxin-like domain-containing protein [Chthoniobacteraceae bacterium]
MRRLLRLAALIAFAATSSAAPVTVKEIDFLLRQQTPEAEILQQLEARRLLGPFDAAAEQQLKGKGASAGLLTILRSGSLLLSPQQTAAAQRRAEPQSVPVPPDARAVAAPAMLSPDHILRQLEGKLVAMQGDELKPFDAQSLRNVRLFVFYNSAAWCGPCRKFTPRLVQAYKVLKAAHPDFELIFLSSDRDEFNMLSYMRSARMPWPAMRLGTEAALKSQYCAQSIPWLVCVDRTGRALTTNGVDKKYLNPEEVLQATEYLLTQMK